MFCTQCGIQIEDGFKFCPNCGAKIVAATPDKKQEIPHGEYEYCSDGMTQKREFSDEEMDEIAEKLKLKYPQKRVNAMKEFRMITGVDLKTAKEIIDLHFDHEDDSYAQNVINALNQSSLKRKEKREMRKIPHCPRCKSTAISYGQKPSLSRALLGYGIAGEAGAVIGSMTGKKGYAVCLKCGKTWKI